MTLAELAETLRDTPTNELVSAFEFDRVDNARREAARRLAALEALIDTTEHAMQVHNERLIYDSLIPRLLALRASLTAPEGR